MPKDLRTRVVAWWLAGYNNCVHSAKNKAEQHSFGVGNITMKGFEEFLKNITDSFPKVKGLIDQDIGNRSIMRFPTYSSEESAECAKFLVHCAIKLLNSDSIKEAKNITDNILEGF